MTNDITPAPVLKAIKPYAGWKREQIELVKQTVAKGVTDDELKLFLTVARDRHLNPFSREIYAIKRRTWNSEKKGYDEVMTIQTGIDGFRTIAGRSGLHAGTTDAEFDSEDEPNPKWAKVVVYKRIPGSERAEFTATARWDEYCPKDRDGNPTGQWKKMPYLMLSKCAEALALRKAFPTDLSGLYTEDEMEQADVPTEKTELPIALPSETATPDPKADVQPQSSNRIEPPEAFEVDFKRAMEGVAKSEDPEALLRLIDGVRASNKYPPEMADQLVGAAIDRRAELAAAQDIKNGATLPEKKH